MPPSPAQLVWGWPIPPSFYSVSSGHDPFLLPCQVGAEIHPFPPMAPLPFARLVQGWGKLPSPPNPTLQAWVTPLFLLAGQVGAGPCPHPLMGLVQQAGSCSLPSPWQSWFGARPSLVLAHGWIGTRLSPCPLLCGWMAR